MSFLITTSTSLCRRKSGASTRWTSLKTRVSTAGHVPGRDECCSDGDCVVRGVRCGHRRSRERRSARPNGHSERHQEVVRRVAEGLRLRPMRLGGSGRQSTGRDPLPGRQRTQRTLDGDLRPVRPHQVSVGHDDHLVRCPDTNQSPTVYQDRTLSGRDNQPRLLWRDQRAIRGGVDQRREAERSSRGNGSRMFPRSISGESPTAGRGCAAFGGALTASGEVCMLAIEGCG
jgi:hypothetical protein